ncbi:hypothetical protein QMM96_22610 [Citrobacter freundii]|uniref:hypothetical protein n=1 Tax=Citrobacter freundii TaxID=546 RepID=UPI002B240BF0|nr:hypothetical protein [Citrobacter freundii]MEB2478226.1 hypothetical protein [Citrobacter freundii]
MTNNQLPDEFLEKLATSRVYPLDRGYIIVGDDLVAMAIELLERRKASAEPIAYLYSASFERGHVEGQLTDAPGCDLPVYAAAPVVPEDVPDVLRDEIIDLCDGYEIGDAGAQEIWSACRATILEGNRA